MYSLDSQFDDGFLNSFGGFISYSPNSSGGFINYSLNSFGSFISYSLDFFSGFISYRFFDLLDNFIEYCLDRRFNNRFLCLSLCFSSCFNTLTKNFFLFDLCAVFIGGGFCF